MLSELLQPSHLIVIGGGVFLFFGGHWFARAGHGFRDAIRNFRAGLRSVKEGRLKCRLSLLRFHRDFVYNALCSSL